MRGAESHETAEENATLSSIVGIDFSGATSSWLPSAANATVWLAFLGGSGQRFALDELYPVQDLPGGGDAFSKLVNWLRESKFTAAAIDAPFSIPASYIPHGSHAELLRRVEEMPLSKGRLFPTGDQLLGLARSVSPLTSLKPLRRCKSYWARATVRAIWESLQESEKPEPGDFLLGLVGQTPV